MKYWKLLVIALLPLQVNAGWNVEKVENFKGDEVKTYLYKINSEGHKLVLDHYFKRLIFIREDKTYRRGVDGIKIDGVFVKAWGDTFEGYPQQTAILFENKDEVIQKLKDASKIEINVEYFKDGYRVSVFKIK